MSLSNASSATPFKSTCHCRTNCITVSIPNSSLPLQTHFCHCNICRRTHGTLATIHTQIPEPMPEPRFDDEKWGNYETETVTRFFCSTCGAHVCDRAVVGKEKKLEWYAEASVVEWNGEDEEEWGEQGVVREVEQVEWYAEASLLEWNGEEEEEWEARGRASGLKDWPFVFTKHIHVGSTNDGGLASWLRQIDGKKLEVWKEGAGSELLDLDTLTYSPAPPSEASRLPLEVSCHCAGVRFFIAPPRSEDIFHDTDRTITPRDRSRWYALNDVCHSCRLTSSSSIISWMFPLASHLSLPDGSPWSDDHVVGTAKRYRSSEEVVRTFCGKCGATVSYTHETRPGEIVDVAVGLVDIAGDEDERRAGVRLEEWLEWRRGRVAHEGNAWWKGLVGGLIEGSK